MARLPWGGLLSPHELKITRLLEDVKPYLKISFGAKAAIVPRAVSLAL